MCNQNYTLTVYRILYFALFLKKSHFQNVVLLHINPGHAGYFFKVLFSTL